MPEMRAGLASLPAARILTRAPHIGLLLKLAKKPATRQADASRSFGQMPFSIHAFAF
jgi:hypothetical protein